MAANNCQYSTRYCWDADKVKALIRLRAELSPLFTGKRNASKYAWAVVERELNVPLPLSKIIKKWNNLLQEYKAIKISEEPKRREWPFFSLMDVYFSDQVNDPSLRLFSSTKTLKESLDESVFEDDPVIASAIAAATSGACMEIDELLKRQKERRAVENKCAIENNLNTKTADYSYCGNQSNVRTEKSSKSVQHKDSMNNYKRLSDQQEIKSDKTIPLHPLFQQAPSPTPQIHSVQNRCSDSNTIDQYLLSWNNFLGNMSRGFHTLQRDEKMVDVTIAAGGKIFKAHKLVLSVCSPYFQEIFLENPSNHPILLMADVEANHMAGLLNFMYSGQVNVKYEDLPVFLKVAEAMKIKGLHTEKPEGQDFKEIQFSREDCSNTWNPPTIPIPVHNAGHRLYSSIKSNEETTLDETFSSAVPVPVYSVETSCHNVDDFSKSNVSKNILTHKKHQKYFAKRKNVVLCENDLNEKRNLNNLGSPLNLLGSQVLPIIESYNTNEVLNLAQNGFQKLRTKCLSMSQSISKNTDHDTEGSFTGNEVCTSVYNDKKSYILEPIENCKNLFDDGSSIGGQTNISVKDQRLIFCNKDSENVKSNDKNNNYDMENNNSIQTEHYIDNDIYKKHELVSKKIADDNNNVCLALNANTNVEINESGKKNETVVKEATT